MTAALANRAVQSKLMTRALMLTISMWSLYLSLMHMLNSNGFLMRTLGLTYNQAYALAVAILFTTDTTAIIPLWMKPIFLMIYYTQGFDAAVNY